MILHLLLMGMIFQQFQLLAQRNVLQNVCFPLELQGMDKKKREDAKKNYYMAVEMAWEDGKIEEYEKSVKNGSRFRKEQQDISKRCTEVLDGIVRHATFDR